MARVLPAKDASLVVGMIQTDIIQQLHHYSPGGLTETEWARARAVATAAVLATGVTSLRQAQNSLSRLGVFLAWHPVWNRAGAPNFAELLAPKYIDSFVSTKKASRSTRTYLRRIARAAEAMPSAAPIASQRTRPVAVAFWIKVVGLGSFTTLAAAYRRRGHSLMVCTFGGITEYLSGTEWDLGGLVVHAQSPDDSSDLAPQQLAIVRAAALELCSAPDAELSRVVRPVKRAPAAAKAAKPLSRTAIVRAAKAAQGVRDAAAEERATGKVTEPTLAALPVLGPEIAAAIAAFRPYRFGEDNWVLVADATHHLATAYDPPSVEWVRTQMGVLARFALWVTRRPERPTCTEPLRTVELLGAGLVDEYLAGPFGSSPDATRATVRSSLRRGVKRLAPDLAGPVISYQPVQAPYSAFECASFVRLARNQPTPTTRRGLSAIVALGLGAGLSAQEQRAVTPQSVFDLDLGQGVIAVFVKVVGARARTVVVRAEYEELLREALAIHRQQGRGPSQLLYGRTIDRPNVTTPVTSRAKTALATGIALDPARLRSTWLVACMSAPVPLGALLRASGLRSARTLVDLVGYCPTPDEASVTAVLRTFGVISEDEVGS
jgi:hypothetical protein